MDSFNNTLVGAPGAANNTRMGTGLQLGRPGGPPLTSMPDLYYLRLVGFPILFFLITLGAFIACLTIRRPNIRKHSSAVYLMAMILADFVSMCTLSPVTFFRPIIPELTLNNQLCAFLIVLTFTSRFGSCALVIALALERVLILSNPKKFAGLARPQMAIIFTCICLTLTLLLGSYMYHGLTWHPKKGCVHAIQMKITKSETPQNIYRVALTFAGVGILLVLNIILGLLLHRKKKNAENDPIQNSIAQARNRSTQLNKINSICLVMSVTTLISNLPSAIIIILIWQKDNLPNMSPRKRQQLFATLQFLAILVLGVKSYLIVVISPKIRREVRHAVTCSNGNDVSRDVIKQIKPTAGYSVGVSFDGQKKDVGNEVYTTVTTDR